LVIVAFAAADIRGARTGLRGRLAVWLGEISFGFYICQGVVVFYGRRLLGAQPFNGPLAIAVIAGIFAATLLGGWLLYTCVERPTMRRWARKRPHDDPVLVRVAPAEPVASVAPEANR